MSAIQNLYDPEYCHCWGCGAAHPYGLHLKSYLSDNHAYCYCHHTPDAVYTGGVPDNLYGGFIAMLFDCHGTAAAAALYLVAHGEELTADSLQRFITAHLEVDYLAPTPMGTELEVRAYPVEVTDRKVILSLELHCGERITARGKMVAVKHRRPTTTA